MKWIIVAAVFATSLSAQQLTVSATEKSLAQIVVQKTDGSFVPYGTAFFVGTEGTLATALHVFNQATLSIADSRGGQLLVRRVNRTLQKYVTSGVELKTSDASHDLAILKLTTTNNKAWEDLGGIAPLSLSNSKVLELGTPVKMFGYFGSDLFPVALRGDLAGETAFTVAPGVEIPEFLVSVFAFPGQSGSPVLLESGEVIGVAIAMVLGSLPVSSAPVAHSGLTKVTKVEHLKRLLEPPAKEPLPK